MLCVGHINIICRRVSGWRCRRICHRWHPLLLSPVHPSDCQMHRISASTSTIAASSSLSSSSLSFSGSPLSSSSCSSCQHVRRQKCHDDDCLGVNWHGRCKNVRFVAVTDVCQQVNHHFAPGAKNTCFSGSGTRRSRQSRPYAKSAFNSSLSSAIARASRSQMAR